MAYKDPEKAKANKRRYLERKRVAKYGDAAAGVDMRGRHGNHACGSQNGRWNADERRLTSHGYIAVRVPVNHPHAWGPSRMRRFKYAYEHVVVMMGILGRPLADGEVVHHKNGNKQDNHPDNLELLTAQQHIREHNEQRKRDSLGRFLPADLRVRQWPEARGV